MSTRCQVKIVPTPGVSPNPENTFMLYHHCDGYPSNMVPLLLVAAPVSPMGWKAGRTGMVASLICSADPDGYEMEQGEELHGDIEYLYVIYTVGQSDNLDWELEIYTTHGPTWNKFWSDPSMQNMTRILDRTPIALVSHEQVEANEEKMSIS